MKVIICPGIHQTQLTNRFVNSVLLDYNQQPIDSKIEDFLIFSTESYPAYSPFHLYQWLNKPAIFQSELLFICFSAGVVGGIGAALALNFQGVKIKGLIAIDGWGVPLVTNFPIYRFSHDYFTHWSSALLGTGKESFYSDPSVPHLTLWESPETCHGWIIRNSHQAREIPKTRSSAQEYLQAIIKK